MSALEKLREEIERLDGVLHPLTIHRLRDALAELERLLAGPAQKPIRLPCRRHDLKINYADCTCAPPGGAKS